MEKAWVFSDAPWMNDIGDSDKMNIVEPFAKLEAALYEVPVPKDGSISTNPIAKAIGEELSSHYLVPPRVWSASSFAKGSKVSIFDLDRSGRLREYHRTQKSHNKHSLNIYF